MRSLAIFVAGILVAVVVQVSIAQSSNSGIIRVNHVGISVPDLDAAVDYYSNTLGFEEAFRITNDQGQTALVYLQVSQYTFVELLPANDDRPPGINHFGVQVEDMDTAVAMWRGRGAEVQDPRQSSTNAVLSNIFDADGVRMELLELPASSEHAQASARWQ